MAGCDVEGFSMDYLPFNVTPSFASTSVSIAGVVASDLKPSTVIFFGHAFATSQVCAGFPSSSSRLIVTVWRLVVFILVSFSQSHIVESPLKIPFLSVTSPDLRNPGIFNLLKDLLSPAL